MRLVILGPPGSGKGTQAELLSKKFGVPAISVGHLLREEVAKGTKEGKVAEGYMKKGEWVPHDITFKVLRNRLEQSDTEKGFILDAFPRLSAEFHQLGSYLIEREWDLDAVINLQVPDIECIRRIRERAKLQSSKGVFRPDVSEETTLNRLKIHHETSIPILEYYSDAGLLKEINADRPIGIVHSSIMRELGEKSA